MNNQPSIAASLTKEQWELLSNNLVEAMQILYESVAKRTLKERIQRIKDGKQVQDGGKKYGKYNRV